MDGFRIASAYVEVDADTGPADRKIDALVARLEAVTKHPYEAKVDVTGNAAAQAAKTQAALDAISKMRANPEIDMTGGAAAVAQTAAVAAALAAIGRADATAKVSVDVVPALAGIALIQAALAKVNLGALFGGPAVFGGRGFGITAAGLHLAIDAMIEFAAVAIPGTIAMLAFGAAGQRAGTDIYNHLSAALTVMDATGQAVKPLTGAYQALGQAVQPDVFQAYGAALTMASQGMGSFGALAKSTGSVVADFAAKMVVDMKNSGGAVSGLVSQGSKDFSQFLQILGNLGGVISNLIRGMPGFAEAFLGIAVALSKLLQVITDLPTPVLQALLALHGLYLWGRLAVGIFASVAGRILGMAEATRAWIASAVAAKAATASAAAIQTAMDAAAAGTTRMSAALDAQRAAAEGATAAQVTFAAGADGTVVAVDAERTAAVTAALATGAMAAAEDEAAASTGLLATAMAALDAVDPLVWIAAAAVAFGTLIYFLAKGKSAAEQMTGSMQQMTLKASNLDAINVAAANMAALEKHAGGAGIALGNVSGSLSRVERAAPSAMALAAAGAQVNAGLQQQSQDIRNTADGAAYLAGKYHMTASEALALADVAGVKLAKGILGSGQAAQDARQQVANLVAGWQGMGIQGGILGADMNAVTFAAEQQQSKISTLNSAWSTFMGTVTGGGDAFDTFQLGEKTLTANFHSATAAAATTTHTLGGLKVSATLGGAAMDGLSQASLTVNQAFISQVNNASALLTAMRLQMASTGQTTQATKDLVAQMLPMAKGSQDATTYLYALAQQADYTGSNSFKGLAGWLGKTHDAEGNLKTITTGLTKGVSNLGGDAKALSDTLQALSGTLQTSLDQMMVSATEKAYGMSAAMVKWAEDVKNGSTQSVAAQATLKTLANGFIATGLQAHDSNTQIAVMIATILHIPLKVATVLVAQGVTKAQADLDKYKNTFSSLNNMTSTTFMKLAFSSSGFTTLPAYTPPASSASAAAPHGTSPGQARGGLIRGPGTGTSDSIDARLSDREYVQPADAVDHYGLGLMDAIRTRSLVLPPGTKIRGGDGAREGRAGRYAAGGSVQASGSTDLTGQFAWQWDSAFASSLLGGMRAVLGAATGAVNSGGGPGIIGDVLTGGPNGAGSSGLPAISAAIIRELQGTAAQISAAIAAMTAEVLKAYNTGKISGYTGSYLTNLLANDNVTLKMLVKDRQQLVQEIAAANAYAKNVEQAAEQWASLTEAQALGSAPGITAAQKVTASSITAGLGDALHMITAFSGAIRKLAKEGLNKTLLDQVIQMGPGPDGLAYARALEAATPAQLAKINAEEAGIVRQSTLLGQTAADAFYGLGDATGKGFLKGLKDSLKSIDSIMEQIIRQLIAKLKKDLKIKSPSEVMAEIGAEIPAGLAVGMRRGQRDVNAAADDLTGWSRQRRTGGIGTYGQQGGSQGITVIFNGTKFPTPEQLHAMNLGLTMAVANA